MKYTFPYWGPFVLETKVEQEFVDIVLEKGNESREKNLDHRSQLAGMIDNEYYYEDYDDWFLPKFTPYINLYIETLKSNWLPNNTISKQWKMKNLWINYQQAYEYNPPHNHGGDVSFVIYLQVPDEIVKENKETTHEHNNAGPGMIVFDYGVQVLFTITRYCKLPEVGDLYIFPAWLPHYVHAFKSNVERISVSGNIKFLYD